MAEAAVKAGANIINDVSGLKADPKMAKTAADSGAAVVLMYNRRFIDKGATDFRADDLTEGINYVRESIKLAKKAAAGARDTFIHSFKYSEQRILAIVSNVSDLPSSALGRLKKLVRYREHGIYSEEQTDIPEIDIEQDPLDSPGL